MKHYAVKVFEKETDIYQTIMFDIYNFLYWEFMKGKSKILVHNQSEIWNY